MKKKIRIAINAQIPINSGAGGIETVLRVLTSLNQFGGDEEYIFITHWSKPDWLKPLLGERQTTIRAPNPEQFKRNKSEIFKRFLGPLRPLIGGIKHFFVPPKVNIGIPTSNGFYESLNCDVIHFPYQDFVYCRVPTIFNPHDIQHLYYPQFFAPEEIQRREIIYPAACRAATTVVTASEFVKQDLVQNYEIDGGKIEVIPWSLPKIDLQEFTENEVKELLKKYECPLRPFILYPAMTWEHKNHLRLLEAVALLSKRDGLKIDVICTGNKNSFYWQIEKQLRELNLEDQFRFVGIVEYKELSLFYRLAQFVIIPTLFEAASGPLLEAWQHNVAVACSSVTSLPEQAGDAALLFNPFSIEEIANTIKRMTTDRLLRENLRAKGTKRLQQFSFERMAQSYHSVYRKASGII